MTQSSTKPQQPVPPRAKRTPSGGYAQLWPAYNRAQVREKDEFRVLLAELCRGVEEPDQITGKPRIPRRDLIFAAIFKTYCDLSARRATCDLEAARDVGLLSRVPAYNTVLEFMQSEALTPYLHQLITQSSLPLEAVESYFAVDSTGLHTCRRRAWYDRHRKRLSKRRVWLKLHVMTGVNTNVITCAEVSDGSANDSPFFGGLVRNTARHFDVAEVSADAAYLAAHNMREVLLVGGIPYIAFKANSSPYGAPKSTFWKRMLELYRARRPEFMSHYNRRNNVESTFFSIKEKFGERLRGKSFRAQVNEALCKVLCHNLCCVIQSMHELGVAPTFWAEPATEGRDEAAEASRHASDGGRLAAALAQGRSRTGEAGGCGLEQLKMF